jgi:hypothetical protein
VYLCPVLRYFINYPFVIGIEFDCNLKQNGQNNLNRFSGSDWYKYVTLEEGDASNNCFVSHSADFCKFYHQLGSGVLI